MAEDLTKTTKNDKVIPETTKIKKNRTIKADTLKRPKGNYGADASLRTITNTNPDVPWPVNKTTVSITIQNTLSPLGTGYLLRANIFLSSADDTTDAIPSETYVIFSNFAEVQALNMPTTDEAYIVLQTYFLQFPALERPPAPVSVYKVPDTAMVDATTISTYINALLPAGDYYVFEFSQSIRQLDDEAGLVLIGASLSLLLDPKIMCAVSNDLTTLTTPATSILGQYKASVSNDRIFAIFSENVDDNPDIACIPSLAGYILVPPSNNYSMRLRFVANVDISGANGNGLSLSEQNSVTSTNANFINGDQYAGGVWVRQVDGNGTVSSGQSYNRIQNQDWITLLLIQNISALLTTRTNADNSVLMNNSGARDITNTAEAVMIQAVGVNVLMPTDNYPKGYLAVITPITPTMISTGIYTGTSFETEWAVFVLKVNMTLISV